MVTYDMEGAISQISKEIAQEAVDSMQELNNVTNETFQTAAEMFFYLNLCPKSRFEWIQLFSDLLEKSSPDIILQTLNRILVTARRKRDKVLVEIVKKILLKVFEKLPLNIGAFNILTKLRTKEIMNQNTSIDVGNLYIKYKINNKILLFGK